MTLPDFPYELTRAGVVMVPDPNDPFEAEGVLNPAAGWASDGRLVLFPRVVAQGNWSRIAATDVVLTDGVPTSVVRRGIVLASDRTWERGNSHGGVEDPRVTWIAELGLHVMTYVAYGPAGPRTALATSPDLEHWTRLGPIQFAYEDSLDTDLNTFPNKDAVWFPESIPGPYGEQCFGFIHRPMFDRLGAEESLPPGIADTRPSIWLSYVPVAAALADPRALVHPFAHREIARPEADWEVLRIGGGPPPVRVPEGWLFLYHGVSGRISDDPFERQTEVCYSAGGMILDTEDPSRILHRTKEPLMVPETGAEQSGVVNNVVFPTAIVDIEGRAFCFYGMADAAIGVATITRRQP
ncbi:MAG: glycoside hydrolase family 130 protein [Propionibacteriaceae bacterium]